MNIRSTYTRLDSVDTALLTQLQLDGKTALNELGKKVGMSASSVMERLRKLEKNGVIEGYFAKIDARKLGLDVACFIGISIQNPEHLKKFEVWIEGQAQVLECHHVTGTYTVLLKIRTRDTESLEELIRRLRSQEGVLRTETLVVLSTQTEHTRLPLYELEDDLKT